MEKLKLYSDIECQGVKGEKYNVKILNPSFSLNNAHE